MEGGVGVAPVIEEQPTEVTAIEGGVLELSVTVRGTEPLSYQWYKEGEEIAGATGALYTVEGVKEADAGMYTVKVMNPYGEAESEPIKVSVVSPVMFELTNPELIIEEGVEYFIFNVEGVELFKIEGLIGEEWVEVEFETTAEGKVKILADQQAVLYRGYVEGGDELEPGEDVPFSLIPLMIEEVGDRYFIFEIKLNDEVDLITIDNIRIEHSNDGKVWTEITEDVERTGTQVKVQIGTGSLGFYRGVYFQ